jgi:hypothetical protein
VAAVQDLSTSEQNRREKCVAGSVVTGMVNPCDTKRCWLCDRSSIRNMNQQVKRFENHAQLIRHIHEQTGVPKDELWQQLNEQL